ncbi:hypothetical protein U5817_24870 [Aromatoleum evansii]|uniref:Uncharacterized protein n=1 Tax=Aromatoleum evansii TaxID=59406 RepID=A0ABZ1AKK0_AROEV|nr:hypothetical protein U5817_24870 [Aromatoleum evansii]
MTEDDFTDRLADAIAERLAPYHVGRKRSLLYDLSFDHNGVMAMGVDPDTGEPIRGKGRGFEQDLLVFEDAARGHTSVIPRIVAEVKYKSVTTHDVIVYSEKADRIRRVYPYVRYGFVLGGMKSIPGRVLRLGQRFDFVVAIGEELTAPEVNDFAALMKEEAEASVSLSNALFGNTKPTLMRKMFSIK